MSLGVAIAIHPQLGAQGSAAAPPGPTTYLLDTFTAADGTALIGHTPDVNTGGGAYVAFGANFLQINSNALQARFGTIGGAAIATGQADGVLRITFTAASDPGALSGGRVSWRHTDTDNHFQVNLETTGTKITLYKHEAAVTTAVDSINGLSPAITLPFEFTVTIAGNVMTAQVTGRADTIVTTTDAFNAAETGLGLWNNPADVFYDNFSFASA